MRALILLHGIPMSPASLVRIRYDFDLVLVTDGAANDLAAEIKPHVICGDFDSMVRARVELLHPDSEMIHLPDLLCGRAGAGR